MDLGVRLIELGIAMDALVLKLDVGHKRLSGILRQVISVKVIVDQMH